MTESTEFFDRVNTAQTNYPPNLIINADETSAKVATSPLIALRDIGSGPPKVNSKANPKLAVSIVGAINANGSKLPSALLARGKTLRSLTKFDLPKPFTGILTPKGWMNGKAMIEWIDRVLLPYTKGVPCCLIVDDLPAHQTSAVLDHCHTNNVELILVPGWSTPYYQPLDVGVFGPLKHLMRHLWKDGIRRGDDTTETLRGLIQRFRTAQNGISKTAVKRAWEKAGITGIAESSNDE
jgi:DDE superfamily endonuclease